MPMLDHNAIYKAYPEAFSCDDDEGVKDKDGNALTIDQSNLWIR